MVDRPFGLDQGFETFDGPARRQQAAGEYMLERSAGETVDRALAWLASRRADEGSFLWVHLFDPHAPYEAPRPFPPDQVSIPAGSRFPPGSAATRPAGRRTPDKRQFLRC